MEAWASSATQSTENRELRAHAESVLRHWQQRSEYLLAAVETEQHDDAVPFQPTFMARIVYRHVGRLRPFPYSLDE